VRDELSQHRHWIVPEHEDVAANDGIEGLLEGHGGGITLTE
jgi:hypothetical protein